MLRMLTKDSGIIALSTPNGLSSNRIRELYRSGVHIKEYTPSEFYSFFIKF